MSSDSSGASKEPKITGNTTDLDLPAHVQTGFMKYREVKPFAQGGSARLDTCMDMYLRRQVVLKRLLPGIAGDPKTQRRFLREARVTAQLAHPGMAPVYELSRDNEGNPYFTMKRLEGQTLRDILIGLGSGNPAYIKEFSLARRVEILLQICNTIACAHDRGVIHCDLKPDNILVGRFGEVIVLDWGLARVSARAENPPTGLDDLGSAEKEGAELDGQSGTPLYMSPEQLTRRGPVDERGDIYSLGAIPYELLTWRPAFWGNDMQEIIHNVLHETPIAPRRLVPSLEIPSDLAAISMQSLAKNPDDRFQTVQAFIADLHAWREKRVVWARKDSVPRRIFKWTRRHLALSMAVAFLLVGIGITQLTHWWYLRGSHSVWLEIPTPGFTARLSPIDTGDETWQALGPTPIRLTNLSPGRYRVQLSQKDIPLEEISIHLSEKEKTILAIPKKQEP